MNKKQVGKVTDYICSIQFAIQGEMNHNKWTLKDLAKATGLSQKRLREIQGDDAEFTILQDLLLVCVALNLEPVLLNQGNKGV